ncbi:MAG: hypothetical protein IPM24_09230 [Bryobacterales bacterium]|jgi:hypothetical protein|nr:hypothetical protein [Bryobacterales bacterium]
MKWFRSCLFVLAPLVLAGSANEVRIEITGIVERVELVRGQGQPFLVVSVDGTPERVVLGSMRYLVEQDFKPKSGEQVVVKGIRHPSGDVIAITVTLGTEKRVLRLRSDDGRPLWTRGRGKRQ